MPTGSPESISRVIGVIKIDIPPRAAASILEAGGGYSHTVLPTYSAGKGSILPLSLKDINSVFFDRLTDSATLFDLGEAGLIQNTRRFRYS